METETLGVKMGRDTVERLPGTLSHTKIEIEEIDNLIAGIKQTPHSEEYDQALHDIEAAIHELVDGECP